MPRTAKTFHIDIRADASSAIGYGHVRRTLAVVERLRAIADVEARYLMMADSDDAAVRAANCDVVRLPDDRVETLIDVARTTDGPLIVDRYVLAQEYLDSLYEAGLRAVVFDDGRRLEHYPAAAVIDCAPGAELLGYRGPEGTRFLLGAEYYPLRREFVERRQKGPCSGEVGRLVVTFGGSDPQDQTARVLQVLARQTPPWKVVAVAGPGYAGRAEEVVRQNGGLEVRRNVSDMAEVLSAADMAISASGGTALEVAYLGLPTVLIVLCENQEKIARAVSGSGSAVSLGRWEKISDDAIWEAVTRLANDQVGRNAMRQAGHRLVDGRGADRIARMLLDLQSVQTPMGEMRKGRERERADERRG